MPRNVNLIQSAFFQTKERFSHFDGKYMFLKKLKDI